MVVLCVGYAIATTAVAVSTLRVPTSAPTAPNPTQPTAYSFSTAQNPLHYRLQNAMSKQGIYFDTPEHAEDVAWMVCDNLEENGNVPAMIQAEYPEYADQVDTIAILSIAYYCPDMTWG